uniref:Uncharacterized protein n=1 Tax=Ralstonia solanacearum TaxID=305 RepID=A0A0S4X682_RALSL|nr:exported protein of unknown function [Ralstonia solanacearum]
MKPLNWISTTGRSPIAAMPMAAPASAVSASGVSMTRSAPKRACSPTVARNTPPLTPMSSPSSTTDGSCSSACASARFTASTRLTSAMAALPALRRKGQRHGALRLQRARQGGIQVVEHRRGAGLPDRQVRRHRLLHLGIAGAAELLFLGLVPGTQAHQVVAQAQDRLAGPGLLDAVRIAVARGVVRRGVVAQPVAERFDQRRAAARAGLVEGVLRGLPHGDHVVAVHLPPGDARGDRLLGQGLRGGLAAARHRDRPLVVVDDEHQRRAPHAGQVHPFIEIALGGAAVTEHRDGDTRLAAQLERVGGPRRVADLGADRHAVREIFAHRSKAAAALVAAPVQQALGHADAAQQLRAVVAVGREQDVFGPHGAGHAHADRLLADRRGKGAELAGALQRDGLGVERARQHHGAIQREQGRHVLRKRRQWLDRLALGVKVLRVVDLKAADRAHDCSPLCSSWEGARAASPARVWFNTRRFAGENKSGVALPWADARGRQGRRPERHILRADASKHRASQPRLLNTIQTGTSGGRPVG